MMKALNFRDRIKGWFESKPRTLIEEYYNYKESLAMAFFAALVCIVGICALHVTDFYSVRFMTVMLGVCLSFFFLALAWSWRGIKRFRREYEVIVSIKKKEAPK